MNNQRQVNCSFVYVPIFVFIIKPFLNEPSEIELAERMVPIQFYTSPLQGIGMTISILMIMIGKPLFSFILLLSQLNQLLISRYYFFLLLKCVEIHFNELLLDAKIMFNV